MEFEAGRNCWKTVRASRAAPVVDAAAYYELVADALLQARRQIWILGWDLHSRVCLRADGHGRDASSQLLSLLQRAVRDNPELHVNLLIWDFAPLFALERESLTAWRFRLKMPERVHFHFASDHPLGASHHQKVVVIDDALAFAGGIDLTVSRWDERGHRADDPRRVTPQGTQFAPYHDVQMAVAGEGAQALAELARERWLRATGTRIEPLAEASRGVAEKLWPQGLPGYFRDVDLAIARTQGAYRHHPEVREAEAAFQDAIASAERCLYIENQYLTSRAVEEALAARLREKDGPEVVIVTPQSLGDGIEHLTMGVLRTGFVERLAEADEHGRLEVRCPVVEQDAGVYVHAKVMVVDDRLLRIGSANLSNRSMALDTECDLLVRASSDEEHAAVLDFRDGLLAEHLGCEIAQLREALSAEGSVCGVLRSWAGSGRGLRRLEPIPADQLPTKPNPAWMDPDAPMEQALADDVVPQGAARQGKRRMGRIAATFAVAVLVGGVYAWMSQGALGEPDSWVNLLEAYRANPWGPVWTGLAFALAASAFVPVTTLIVAVSLLWSPWVACAVSLSGAMASACATYAVGRGLRRRVLGGGRSTTARTIGRWLERRGVLSVAVMRLLPVAPFTAVNLAAGAARVAPLPFTLGTGLGMLPGVVALSWTSSSIIEALRRPGTWNVAMAVSGVVLLAGAMYGLRRLLQRRSQRDDRPSVVPPLEADVARR